LQTKKLIGLLVEQRWIQMEMKLMKMQALMIGCCEFFLPLKALFWLIFGQKMRKLLFAWQSSPSETGNKFILYL